MRSASDAKRIVLKALQICGRGRYGNMQVHGSYAACGYLKIYYGTPSRSLLWADVALPGGTPEQLDSASIRKILTNFSSVRVRKIFEYSKDLIS